MTANDNRTLRNPKMLEATGNESAELAAFAAGLRFEDIPKPVVDRAVDFFVDWAGSALSGRGQRAIAMLEKFAADDGTGRRALGDPDVARA